MCRLFLLTSCIAAAVHRATADADSFCGISASVSTSLAQHCATGDKAWFPVSVKGAGIYCVEGPICVADTVGACPGPQPSLPFGSSCELMSDVHGCVPRTACPSDADTSTGGCDACPFTEHIPKDCEVNPAWSSVSVEGSATFCVRKEQRVCAGDIDGVCPGPQPGLRFGSTCQRVRTGVLGCVPITKCPATCGSNAGSSHNSAVGSTASGSKSSGSAVANANASASKASNSSSDGTTLLAGSTTATSTSTGTVATSLLPTPAADDTFAPSTYSGA